MHYSTPILFIFLSLSTGLFGQKYAEFTTDTTRFEHLHSESASNIPEEISSQEWFINGQRMSYGSGTIRVKVDPDKLDTLVYTGYRQRKSDTIICNIREPKKYTFFYNECCGAFNIRDDENKRFLIGSVRFEVKKRKRKTHYLGTLGESGMLITSATDTLKVGCRSAMSPNVYNVSLQRIEIDQDSTKNTDGTCLQIKGAEDPVWDYSFKSIEKPLHFLYLPLSNEPLFIRYDELSGSIYIE